MKIFSDKVQITGNIFEQMDESIFDNIQPKSATDFSFDFSNNIIHFLSPRSLKGDLSQLEVFTNVTITNNIIECIGSIAAKHFCGSSRKLVREPLEIPVSNELKRPVVINFRTIIFCLVFILTILIIFLVLNLTLLRT